MDWLYLFGGIDAQGHHYETDDMTAAELGEVIAERLDEGHQIQFVYRYPAS